jgi:sodium transport system permease protein
VSFALLPSDLIDTDFALGPWALVQLLVVILPIVLLGATVLTALAAYARSYREAQGYLPLLIFLPMVPTLVLMVAPVRTQAWMLAVPFLGQNQLILKILRSEPVGPGEWVSSVGAGLALVALAWLVAARLYHREHLAASS